MYLYQIDKNIKHIYYITPKCATRTFFKVFNYKPTTFREAINHNKEYFSWTFVRNPYDRLVSSYINKVVDKHQGGLKKYRHIKTFKEFVHKLENVSGKTCDRHIRSLYTFFPPDIDFIGRFENLQSDFNLISERLGVSDENLPHINKTNHKHYTEYYDDETVEIVKEKYADDLEMFGYEFGD
jgi:hypothetical protein